MTVTPQEEWTALAAVADWLAGSEAPRFTAGAVSDGANFRGSFYWPAPLEPLKTYWVVALHDRRRRGILTAGGKDYYLLVSKTSAAVTGPVTVLTE